MRWPWLLLLAGCPWEAPTPTALVHHGPGFREPPRTLVALPVACSDQRGRCSPAHTGAVASIARQTLERTGYRIVASEAVNAEMRRTADDGAPDGPGAPRPGPADPGSPGSPGSQDIEPEVRSASWTELSVARQDQLFRALGIAGILRTEVEMGRPHGLSSQFSVRVNVTIHRIDGAEVWRSECGSETGDYHTIEQAIDIASRCALEAGSLW